MTEKPLSITTQIATSNQAAFNPTASISVSDALPVIESADEEPYTIKCICDYNDDDGNTIYCEKCDTWQHTECFYPGRIQEASREDFDHACADCKPRFLDTRVATERQRQNRQNKTLNDTGDKKTKRPIPKSHKKKTKPTEVHTNGVLDHDSHRNGSPQEYHHQTKKAKGHRTTPSISSQVKRSPPFNTRPPHPHAHPPSPAHTPPDLPNTFQVHGYSDKFIHLYNHNPPPSTTNTFASLEVTNSMSLWLLDPDKLQHDAGSRKEDVFQYLKVAFDELEWPKLRPVQKESIINNTTLQWKLLVAPDAITPAARIAELNGFVGFQRDYCKNDESARWPDAPHPQPFIFFHPRLPLYIDTRQEGSTCRFVRRSCRANTSLETFIAGGGSEYHFWLISERQIAAGEQLTIPWDFRFPKSANSRYLHLLNLGDEDGVHLANAEASDEEYEQLSQVLQLVLSDHGGCACELGNDCAFARFHRTYYGRSHPQSNGIKVKKGRKPKQNHVSPTSTGYATNSRAASEGQGDNHDEDDNRSASGSSRSKPHSRDLTPSQSVHEPNGILLETSDREKRKLAKLEETFQRLEQGQPPRKKKRASDSSNANSAVHTVNPPPNTKPRQKSVARVSVSQVSTNGQRTRYVDAGTSRRQSDSPFSAASPTNVVTSPSNAISRNGSTTMMSRQTSLNPKPIYVDAAAQTDEVEDAWWSKPRTKPQRKIVPLAKRLLKNRQKIQTRQREEIAQRQASASNCVQNGHSLLTIPMDLDVTMHDPSTDLTSAMENTPQDANISPLTPAFDAPASPDVHMTDVPAVSIGSQIKPPPPPWPNHISTAPVHIPTSPLQRSPDLQLQLPPTPSFPSPTISGPLSASVTPSSATASLSQSPFVPTFSTASLNSLAHNASPVKVTKKLSLSDYKARRKNTDTTNISKSMSGVSPTLTHTTLKPALPTVEEVKAKDILEGPAIYESPNVETLNPLSTAKGSIPESTTSKD